MHANVLTLQRTSLHDSLSHEQFRNFIEPNRSFLGDRWVTMGDTQLIKLHVKLQIIHIACIYRGADKFLARPGRKQAKATEDLMLIYPIYNHNWRAELWYPSSRVQTRPKPSDFSGEKKNPSAPSFGGEVKPSVPCRKFTVCKRTQK